MFRGPGSAHGRSGMSDTWRRCAVSGWLLRPTPIRRSGPATTGVVWVITVRRKASAILRARRRTRLAASRSRTLKYCAAPGWHPEAALHFHAINAAARFEFDRAW